MHLKSVSLHPQGYPTAEFYPFNLPIFHETKRLDFDTPVTLFVGENGTGKSTLLEAVAKKCGIHIWRDPERWRVGYNKYEATFYEHVSVEWTNGRVPGSFFSSSVFQDFIEMLDEWATSDPAQLKHFGGKSLVAQSHGQGIMAFLSSRCSIRGLYLLDEPESALSPKTQIRLREMITEMAAAGHAQFIIATHSPILLTCPDASIYSFDHTPVRPVRYQDTDHYRIYKRFMEQGE